MTAAPFNLLTERWLPVRRRSGGREWITPAQITDGLSADPVVAFDWPRPDFNGASLEFMVGLITTAAAPADEQGWREWWHAPPPPDVLAERFAAVTHAFNLDGDGPRFMQDHSGLRDGKAKDRHISVLLIDTPGAQTLAHNTDIFVRRGRIERLGRPAVAMALYTLQSYAPSGGRGHRTSLRGGGPLTTLVASTPPGTGDCLWGTVWPNVETVAQITGRGDGTPADTIFPWLEPTRMSRKGDPQTTPANVHPLQVYWGMPRCAHVVFDAHEAAACSLTNLPEHSTASRLRSVQYGTDYASHAFDHPLSPYYRQKSGADRIPVHANPGILGYHAWPGVVVPTNDRCASRPAP